MKYIKAFFNTTIGIILAFYLFGCVIMYSFSFISEDSFFEPLLTGYLTLNLFFRHVANAIVGFASLACLGVSWILITEIKDRFITQFKEELEYIENQENKK